MKYTVFTPLYNRKDLIYRVYESLKRQSVRDFEWIIVDDGSTDHPEDVINEWLNNSDFPINFIQKKNGGKHSAINRALKEAKGKYFIICDSDDYLTDDALYLADLWIDEVKFFTDEYEYYIGVGGLKKNLKGEYLLWKEEVGKVNPYGGEPPFEEFLDCSIAESNDILGFYGDKTEIYRTEIFRKYPFPEFEGENFLTEAAIFNVMAKDGATIRYHKDAIEICEYRPDGLSADDTKQYKNPKGLGFALQTRPEPMEKKLQFYLYYYDKLKYELSFDEIAGNVGLCGKWLCEFRAMAEELLEKRKILLEEAVKSIDILEKLALMNVTLEKDEGDSSQITGMYESLCGTICEIKPETREFLDACDLIKAKQIVNGELDDIKAL